MTILKRRNSSHSVLCCICSRRVQIVPPLQDLEECDLGWYHTGLGLLYTFYLKNLSSEKIIKSFPHSFVKYSTFLSLMPIDMYISWQRIYTYHIYIYPDSGYIHIHLYTHIRDIYVYFIHVHICYIYIVVAPLLSTVEFVRSLLECYEIKFFFTNLPWYCFDYSS